MKNNINHTINAIAILLIVVGVGYTIVKLADNDVVAQNEAERAALNASEPINELNMPGTSSEPTSTPSVSSDLKIETVQPGNGAEAVNGKKVKVHYTGTFPDGKKFDSSVDRGQPFEFTLGAGEVIKGWDQGVLGMKVGEKRKLVVPASLGYGPNDYGPIPGNSTLLFDVELLGVE